MIGLLGGLGKGLADAGATYGNAMIREIDAREADDRAMQRAIALDKLKEEREEARLKRDADIYSQAQTAAQRVGAARMAAQTEKDTGALAANAQQMPGDSPAATQEEFKRHLESLTPEQRKMIGDTGLIAQPMSRLRQEMQQYEDTEAEARKLGASSSLMKSLQDSKKERLAEIKLEMAGKKDEQRHQEVMAQNERLGKQFEAMLPIRQQQADAATTSAGAAVTRANRPPSGGAGGGGSSEPKVRSTKTDADGNVIAIMSDGSTKPLGIKSGEFNARLASTIDKMEKADPFGFGKLPEEEKRARATTRLTGSAAPAPAPAPAAPRSGDNGNVKRDYTNLWK